MPVTTIGGIATRYELTGSGPPLLMFAPGGFGAELRNWMSFGIYQRLRLLDHLPGRCTCIMFDRRESGQSGGRVERITWADYADQGRGLLDHLGIERAHLIGGCVGCSVAATFAARYPDRVVSLILYSPAGGARYRIRQHALFTRHLSFVSERGLGGVAAVAAGSSAAFSGDPRIGPWGSVIRADEAFARDYTHLDPDWYQVLAGAMGRLMFDRDTVPGPEPEDLLALDIPALIVPGQDASHATSAARYLEECLPRSEYWDVPVTAQTEQNVAALLLAFLAARELELGRPKVPAAGDHPGGGR
jgi:pimeloyl-ACP methyl ester carboxylesterase